MPKRVLIEPCLLRGGDLPGETSIYKYLSIETFLYLMAFKRLTFSRITSWPDAYEGFRFEFFSRALNDKKFEKNKKDDFFGSCWTLQSEEPCLFEDHREYESAIEELKENGSASMWESYCKFGGVRIMTTLDKLNNLFSTNLQNCKVINRGKVHYEPKAIYSIEAHNLISTFFTKQISFRHESEYRYILVLNEPKEEGLLYVEIDNLFDFLDEILVAPAKRANKWVIRTLYNIGVGISIAPHRGANVKNGTQFCRISQLYGTISEEIGHFDML